MGRGHDALIPPSGPAGYPHQNPVEKEIKSPQRISGVPLRYVVLWGIIIIFANQLIEAVRPITTTPTWSMISDFWSISVFQYMAWYTIFCRLSSSDSVKVANWRHIVPIIAICLLVFLPAKGMIWVAATGIAVFCLISNRSDLRMRAAGVVLAALSVQEFWGHIVFQLISFPLLQAETAVVGTLLQLTWAGTVWHDNVITMPSGHGILLYPYCSSFHNVSLAILCWVTVTNLINLNWRHSNYVTGAIVVVAMIVFNTGRLYLMALGPYSYHYWHEGAGSDIFQIGASLSVLLLTLCGSRLFMGRT